MSNRDWALELVKAKLAAFTTGARKRALASAMMSEPEEADAGETRVIPGVVVMQYGAAKDGRCFADKTTLEQVVALGSGRNVLCGVNHSGNILDTVGCLSNFRLDGAGEKMAVRADLKLLQDSEAGEIVAQLAEMAPDAFGMSVEVFYDINAMADFVHENRDEATKEFKSPDAANAENLIHMRVKSLCKVDVVDIPNLTSGLHKTMPGVPVSPALPEEPKAMPVVPEQNGAAAAKAREKQGMKDRIEKFKAIAAKHGAHELLADGLLDENVTEAAFETKCELFAMKRENEALKMAANGAGSRIAPVGYSAGPAQGEPATKDFLALVEEHKAKHGCSTAKAMSAVAAKHKSAHEAYIEQTAREIRSGTHPMSPLYNTPKGS